MSYNDDKGNRYREEEATKTEKGTHLYTRSHLTALGGPRTPLPPKSHALLLLIWRPERADHWKVRTLPNAQAIVSETHCWIERERRGKTQKSRAVKSKAQYKHPAWRHSERSIDLSG